MSTTFSGGKHPLGQKVDVRHLFHLSLTALGVVYGDIGTSPLYALRVCFYGTHAFPVTHENILGVLSLIFWALTVIISFKYLLFVMRADNRGEGGILALLALLAPWRMTGGRQVIVFALGLFGAALLYGDGAITPAISVLSAVEGLEVAAPGFKPYVLPATVAVLAFLFLFQRRGTSRVGAVFGPVMVVWFLTIALLGIGGIVRAPEVLGAVSPHHAADFFLRNGWRGFVVLGGVFLVVTGGEALYADMGHFGRRPIRFAWFCLVFPSLLLNYFGQGAFLLTNPGREAQPFYHLAPQWGVYPLVLLATVATVIASQAVISGAFSLTRQAVQLGHCPRVRIIQTSSEEIGQIYVPSVNRLLMIATLALVFGFRSSDNLASAYGVAVTTTMVITTILAFFVMRERWQWPPFLVWGVVLLLLATDLSFFTANLFKIETGGWLPLLAGCALYILMSTWYRGREILRERLGKDSLPLDEFLARIAAHPPVRVSGTAVFMSGHPFSTPPMILHHLAHNQVLHEQVIFLTVLAEETPRVPAADRLDVTPMGPGLFQVIARYGYMQSPHVPVVLRECELHGIHTVMESTTFYLGRETLIPTPKVPGMAVWREKLFAFLSRNSLNATAFYNIPAERVVEIGLQVEI